MSKKKTDAVPVPKTLEEAFAILDQMAADEEKKAIIEGDDAHFGLGLWIRNNWFYGADCSKLLEDMRETERGGSYVTEGPDGSIMFFGGGDIFSSTIIRLYRECHLMAGPAIKDES